MIRLGLVLGTSSSVFKQSIVQHNTKLMSSMVKPNEEESKPLDASPPLISVHTQIRQMPVRKPPGYFLHPHRNSAFPN